MKFDILDKFIEERECIQAEHTKLIEKEQKALEKVQELKVLYEVKLRDSIRDGKDVTDELDKLQDDIIAAERIYERIKTSRALFHTFEKRTVKQQDVINAWNTEYIPRYHEEKFDEILARLFSLKKQYTQAVLDYISATDEIERDILHVAHEIGGSDTIGARKRFKFNHVKLDYRRDVEKYFITDTDLHHMSAGNVPTSIKENGGLE